MQLKSFIADSSISSRNEGSVFFFFFPGSILCMTEHLVKSIDNFSV